MLSPVLVVLTLGSWGHAVAPDPHVATLLSPRIVRVIVEKLDADAVKDGLSAKQIRTQVEGRLRRAGLIVAVDDGEPYLYVVVTTAKADEATYAYSLSLFFGQPTVIEDYQSLTRLKTWSVGSVGMAGNITISRAIRVGIGQMMDQFVNAYVPSI